MSLYARILNACTQINDDVAISAQIDLAPISGFDFNKIMPPTYLVKDQTNEYHIEHRLFAGVNREVVVLDSIASCANRCEEAAHRAKMNGLPLADLIVKVKTLGTEEEPYYYYTSQMPHRIFDAAIRDCTLNGEDFDKTEIGKRLFGSSKPRALRAMFEHNPLSLIYGGWCSNVANNRGVKWARVVKSEVVGCVVSRTISASSKIDPLGIESAAYIDFDKKAPVDWKFGEGEKKKKKDGEKSENNPSCIGFGNIAPKLNRDTGGVSVDVIKDLFTFSVHSTYRYVTGNEEEDRHVRASLVCLGLYLQLLKSQIYDLRSNCVLRKVDSNIPFYWDTLPEKEAFELSVQDAKELYLESLTHLPMFTHKDLVCEAKDKLEKLISLSLQQHLTSSSPLK
jgi:CRISPR-associated protein Csb1